MDIKLTQYSHGAGCGCKIAPAVLDSILRTDLVHEEDKRLLVGNDTRDDAAVFDLEDGTAIVSTTDFFMPIVDDPVDFGRIASVNAISDIYAMGGTPLVAIAVLGWPVNTVPIEAARLVIDGARMACHEAGIALAGGHSIDSPEPIFGLAVTGRVSIEHLKKNSAAQAGDVLFLTKPLGVGIITTAQKKGLVDMAHLLMARDSMVQLNKVGAVFGRMDFVHSMTDVTGFGLLGHLKELCDGADLAAEIDFDAVPLLERDVILDYVAKGCIPGGTNRNFDSYGHAVNALTDVQRAVLCDPQTSGGLLVTVDPTRVEDFMSVWQDELDVPCVPIGRMTERSVDPVSDEQIGVARSAVITVR